MVCRVWYKECLRTRNLMYTLNTPPKHTERFQNSFTEHLQNILTNAQLF